MNTLNCVKIENPILGCPPHTHGEWEIIMQLSGNATAIIDNKEYNISPGDVMVIPPGVVHENFSDELFCDMYLRAKNLDFFDVAVIHDKDESILSLINLLHKVLVERDIDYTIIADNLAEAICSYIKRQMSYKNSSYPFVDKLRNIIYENIPNSDFNMAKEIKRLGFNSDYLRRCFKEIVGQTPLEYMTQLRITQAKGLLLHNTFVSVAHVAEACGFNDSFYFSTCFKKHTGLSPRQYRAKKAQNK